MHEARERGWTARLTKEVSLNVESRAELILDHGTLWLWIIRMRKRHKGRCGGAPHLDVSASCILIGLARVMHLADGMTSSFGSGRQ